jgi:hypothetical protein
MFKKFFPENYPVYEMMWKNILETYRPRMTIKYGVYTLHAG